MKRFLNARFKTKITLKYFEKSKNPKRLKNVYIVTFILKITNGKTGFSEEAYFSIGYDDVKTKGQIFDAVEDLIIQFTKDSPNLVIEFIRFVSLISKKGKF